MRSESSDELPTGHSTEYPNSFKSLMWKHSSVDRRSACVSGLPHECVKPHTQHSPERLIEQISRSIMKLAPLRSCWMSLKSVKWCDGAAFSRRRRFRLLVLICKIVLTRPIGTGGYFWSGMDQKWQSFSPFTKRRTRGRMP